MAEHGRESQKPAQTRPPSFPLLVLQIGWGVLALIVLLLWKPEVRDLWVAWQSIPELSHGPLIPLLTVGQLWLLRHRLKSWQSADRIGLFWLLPCALIYVGAVRADIDFLKPLALIGIMLATIRFLGGKETFRTCLGPVGFLIFMIPWPTTLMDHLAFPLQLLSASYAAMLTGILGISILRDGVNLAVMPGQNLPPSFSIVVAQACSGLTSMLVLLALGYLVAYWTPISMLRRMLLMVVVVPLALCANTLRLTVILFAGAHGNPGLAHWIHDHEGPVLMVICSIVLTLFRDHLMGPNRGATHTGEEGTGNVAPTLRDH